MRAFDPSELSRLLDGILDFAIFTLDGDGMITSWNQGAERVYHWTADEILGQHFSTLFPESDREQAPAVLETVLSRGQFSEEVWRVRRDGSSFLAHVTIRPQIAAERRFAGFVNVTHDVTEVAGVRVAIDQANHLAALGAMSAEVAHECRNVVMAIGTWTEVLAKIPQVDPRISTAIQQLATSVGRAKGISENLLRLGRPPNAVPQTIDLHELLSAKVPEFSALVRRNVTVRLEFSSERPEIEFDPLHLNQMLANLVANASDAMPEGGEVVVAVVDSADGRLAIEIRDRGIGIPPEVRSRLFEPFFTTKRAKGTGIGLLVTKKLAESNGASLGVRNEPGGGTTFRLEMTRRSTVPLPEQSVNLSRALFVGSDPDLPSFVREAFASRSIAVTTVTTCSAALDEVARNTPHVLILSINLDDCGGIDAYRRISNEWPQLPILFVTETREQPRLLSVHTRPNVRYVGRPLTPDALYHAAALLVAGTFGEARSDVA